MNPLLKILTAISRGELKEEEGVSSLRQAILDFGSETDDNESCAQSVRLQYGKVCIGQSKSSICDLFWECETDEVFEAVHSVHPKLSRTEIEALLRFSTLVLSAVLEPKENRG